MKLIQKLRLSILFCISALTLAATSTSYAEETASFPSIIGDDFKHEFTAPSRWDAQDWKTTGWATLAVVGTAVVADRPIRDFMCQQSKMSSCPGAGPNAEVTNSALTTIENFGQTYALGVMGGFYLAGAISDNEKPVLVAQDLVSASIVSASVNQALKVSVNRYRPRDNKNLYSAPGFTNINNNSSFASGHTTEAFTLASVIATHYDETWVAVLSYTTAGLVGVARMYHDAHWASDVVASAIIGTYTGKTVVQHNNGLRGKKIVLLPLFTPDMTGVQLVGNF